MIPDAPETRGTPGGSRSDAELADLASAVLGLTREIELRHADEADVVELPVTARMVLRHVDRHPGVAPSAIAEAVGLQRSNVSAALRTLEGAGLVERRPAEGDARGVTVHPTPRAASNLQALRRVWARTLAPAVPAEVDAAALAGLLDGLTETIAAQRRAATSAEPAS